MTARFDFPTVAPDAYEAVAALDAYVRKAAGIEPRLLHLLKLRASQLNGCSFCVDMHVKEARRDGLSEQWINLICVWRDSPVFNARERAVLGWTEALTNIAQTHAPDTDFQPLRDFFTEAEITRISVAVGTINVWNRLCVGFRSQHRVDESLATAAVV